MTANDDGPDDATEQVFEIRLGVYCTAARARDLTDRFQLVLCPDPTHDGPCDVPWSSSHVPLEPAEARERYPALVEQIYHERGRTI